MRHLLPVAALLLAPLGAQDEPTKPAIDARAFVPAGYRCEVFVDFARLRENGILDAMRRSVVSTVFGMLEKELGFALADVDRLRAFPDVSVDPADKPHASVAIFEGNPNVSLPNRDGDESFKLDKINGADVMVETGAWVGDDPEMLTCPKQGLLVIGHTSSIRPVLEGKAKAGVPSGDMLSLTSGRGNLLHVVMAMNQKMVEELPFLDASELPREDMPRFLLARLVEQPGKDGDEGTVVFEATVRCTTGKDGPAKFEAMLRGALTAAEQHPRLGAFKHIWRKIEVKVDGIDLVARLPLGSMREAAATIPMLIAPMFMLGTAEAPAPEAVAEPAEPGKGGEAKPTAEPPKKGGGGN